MRFVVRLVAPAATDGAAAPALRASHGSPAVAVSPGECAVAVGERAPGCDTGVWNSLAAFTLFAVLFPASRGRP